LRFSVNAQNAPADCTEEVQEQNGREKGMQEFVIPGLLWQVGILGLNL